MYAGVLMRSRLEASFAQDMDDRRWNWEYEPICFAGPDGQYLPDFRILFDEKPGSGIYIEVKPTVEAALEARQRMLPIRATYPNAVLAVVAPYPNQTRFGCYAVLKDADWVLLEGYWPDLPGHAPGPCRCGNPWIDPEFGRCEACWRFKCFSCGELFPGVKTVNIVRREECDLCGRGSPSATPRLCGSCTAWEMHADGDIGAIPDVQQAASLELGFVPDPGPGPDHCEACWERIRREHQRSRP